MKYLITCLLIFFAVFSVSAQNKHETAKRVQETIKKLAPIKAYVRSVESTSLQNKGPSAVVTDISDYNSDEKPEWKWYESREDFESDGIESYTTAFIWKKQGKIVQVNFTYSSPSGDWVQYVFHTFYPSGTAAKIDRELRTFMGDVIVNRIAYYDTSGKPVAKYTTYRDLQTRKLIMKPEYFEDMARDFYLNAGDLPFIQKGIGGPTSGVKIDN
ncbi:MAG: hypothetical protein OEM82_09150 [Acidobacteriota bacterium]|nr:hypothetical protein [Acidobacteriota bacterium]MDH3529500.1 hypothetical protein [Acidobacteriota bacterium]